MNIDFSIETMSKFEEYNQVDRIEFCISELKKLKWITVAKVLSDQKSIEIYDSENFTMFEFIPLDVQPSFDMLVVGLVNFHF